MLREDTGANKERLNGLGNNWLRFRRSYFKWSQDIGKAKLLYDILEKKEFNKLKDKNINVFLRHISSMTLIEPDLYALAVFLLNKSNIRGQTIKSEDWKVLEHTNLKKLEVTPRKPMLDSGVKHESS